MNGLLIRGVTLATGETVDILTQGTHIAEVGQKIEASGARIIDGSGLIALTGLVDLHTHLREPGFEQSETVLSGSRAAAAGGFTAVFAMANTSPVADTAGVVEQVSALGDEAGYVTVRPVGAVTVGLRGEKLSAIGDMARSRAKVRVFSDDGKCVHDSLLMRRALEYVKTFDGVVAQHAQDPRLTESAQMNESALSSELGLTGWPAVAEESIIARDVLLAEQVGARLHVCHVSTAGSVEVLRWAKDRGIAVTAEVTPHHLLLTQENVRTYDTRFKVNPPLRREEDVHALREAVASGLIDIVATDHAPHPREAKECEWDAAAFGMVGLESALSVVHTTLVETGMIGWADVQRVLSQKPAEIGRLEGHPLSVSAGEIADLVLIDPTARRTFSVNQLHGLSVNSPFLGLVLSAAVRFTIRHGHLTCADGEVLPIEQIAGEA